MNRLTNAHSRAAHARFLERLEELGATLVETEWKGTRQPHHVVCAAGHDCYPKPFSVISAKRRGVCATCGGNSRTASESNFRKRVAELGGTVTGAYVGVHVAVPVRCGQGHDTSVFPSHVQQGQGICRTCAGKVWDVFYVVAGGGRVKFGITSGDPRPRLNDHRRDGMPDQMFLRTNLPDGHARQLELTILQTLSRTGAIPVNGIEYFPEDCTDLIMSVVRAALSS